MRQQIGVAALTLKKACICLIVSALIANSLLFLYQEAGTVQFALEIEGCCGGRNIFDH